MGKLIGALEFTGSLGRISAYKMRGSDQIIIRRTGGASKEKIKTDPSFERTRENNSAFGGSSKAAQGIRQALFNIKPLGDASLTGRLTALCRVIMNLDADHLRGERSVLFSRKRLLLEGFNFNKHLLFNSVIRQSLTCNLYRDSGNAKLIIPALVPSANFYSPPQHHLFRFIIALGLIPDMVFKPSEGYLLEANLIKGNNAIFSEWFPTRKPLAEQTFELQLENFTGLQDNLSMILGIGIQYGYAVSNSIIEPVKYAGCASILATG